MFSEFEVWGYNQIILIEKLHLKFCKHILNVKPSTPNFMVYGELGRFPNQLKWLVSGVS